MVNSTELNYEKYYINAKKSVKFYNFIKFLVIFSLLVSIFCIFSYFFYYKGIGIRTKTDATTFYFIEANSFIHYSDAEEFACEIQKVSGAGYIYKDSTYRVILCAYFQQSDAESVLNKVKDTYPSARIITYSVNINTKALSEQETEILSVISANLTATYQSFINLDSGALTSSNALNRIRTQNDYLSQLLVELKSDNQNNQTQQRQLYYLGEIYDCDETIINSNLKNNELSSILKYSLVKKIVLYKKICATFS